MTKQNRKCKYAIMSLILDKCEQEFNMNVVLLHEINVNQYIDVRLIEHLVRRDAQVAYLDDAII